MSSDIINIIIPNTLEFVARKLAVFSIVKNFSFNENPENLQQKLKVETQIILNDLENISVKTQILLIEKFSSLLEDAESFSKEDVEEKD